MPSTTLRRRLANAYGVTATPATRAYYGFGVGSGTVEAMLMEDGNLSSSRGSESAAPLNGVLVSILRDSAETVGEGSVAWAEWPGVIKVWDVDAETVYSWTTAGVEAVSFPAYQDGWLYWWTVDTATLLDATVTVRLWSGRADLTSVTELDSETHTLPALFGEWTESVFAIVSPSGVRFAIEYTDSNGEVQWDVIERAGLTGLDVVTTGSPLAYGYAASYPLDSLAVRIAAGYVVTVGVGSTDTPNVLWPQSGSWLPEIGLFHTVTPSLDGSELVAVAAEEFIVGAAAGTGTPASFPFDPELDPKPSVMVPVPDP